MEGDIIMSKLFTMAAALVLVPLLAFASPVLAAGEGQIEGGNIYRVKNVTKNTDFVDPASADACDTLQYWVRIHNPGPGFLSDVKLKATLPSGAATSNTSTMTISAINADPESTSDTATVNVSSSQAFTYESGSTQLLGASGEFLQTLPDGITQGGVSIGNVGVSLGEKRFVLFKVKVNCPTTPVTPAPVKPVAAAKGAAPAKLPSTGPGAVASLFAGTSIAGAAGHYLITRRRQ
jgi:hypothetical protein